MTSEQTNVFLITGFLGAGKTTFLNRVIEHFPKDLKITILVNEFGEIGVDGTLIEGEDIDTIEISKGSIFCVCVKTDFIKGLYELNATVKPDVLLIESTGVANPSDLKKDLKLSIFNNRFLFQEQFCLIDAVHFLDAYQVYASLEKQIASSTAFIINKVDLVAPGIIQAIKEVVETHHPKPLYFETSYADIPLDRFFGFGSTDQIGKTPCVLAKRLTEEELDRFLEELLDSPDMEITPPDTLVSVAYQWLGNDLDQVRQLARALPKEIVRAKGFVDAGDGMHTFNYVMGTWTVEPTDIPMDKISHKNVVVFIGPPQCMDGIANASQAGEWKGREIFQAYSE